MVFKNLMNEENSSRINNKVHTYMKEKKSKEGKVYTWEIPNDVPKINDFIEQVAGVTNGLGDCL